VASISNTKFFENTLIAVNYSLFSKRTRVYRYGFNGKEQDDEVHSSAGTSYDYGERIYDPRIGRFLSVDPFFAKYPELSTYQFASNRPIDGVDLDGLEYATFHIFIQDGTVRNIRTTTDYELKSKTSKGPGVQYNYIYLDKKGKVENVSISMDVNRHGIYQGENNPRLPTVGSRSSELHDDYSQ
jgi:RHS repeat-associated protein